MDICLYMILIKTKIGNKIKKELQADLGMYGDMNTYSFDQAMDKYIEIKNSRPEIIKEEYNIDENGLISYVKPICSRCGSDNVIKDGVKTRIKNGLLERKVKFTEQKYKCLDCDKKFKTENHGLIDKYKHKLNEIINFPKKLRNIAYISLRNTSEIISKELKSKLSHTHLMNIYNNVYENTIFNGNFIFSGYYTYDEQYISLLGQRHYRLLLYDDIINIPVAERIVLEKTNTNIINFISDSTRGQNFFVLTTDLAKNYNSIADYFNVKHNLCTFHTKKYILELTEKYLNGKGKISSKYKNAVLSNIEPIFDALNSRSLKEAKLKLEVVLINEHSLPKKVVEFLKNRVLPDLDRIMMHTTNYLIPMTSNHAETYFSVTLSTFKKKLFKTVNGVISFLKVQMNRWTKRNCRLPFLKISN